MNIFPEEIIENILINCDGKTLLNIQQIDENWKDSVEYITKKTNIWKWCCHEDIPKNQLIEYLDKYNGRYEDWRKWLTIYQNWCSWQKLAYINYGISATPVDMPRISCMAVSVSGNYIAVGSEDGRLKIYKSTWAVVHSARHFAAKIKRISFVDFGEKEEDLYIIIGSVNMIVIRGVHLPPVHAEMIHDVKNYSSFKNYICYEQVGGRFTICKLTCNRGVLMKEDVWFSRLYSPTNVSTLNMWHGVCTFLINNTIKCLNYNKTDMCPMETLKNRARLTYNFGNKDGYFVITELIVRDDVIVIMSKNEQLQAEFIEFFFLNENNTYSTKLFNSWEIFTSSITCIFVYGNTLIIGDEIGNLYLYHVSSWKNLDLRNYGRKIIVGKHPIINIDVKEDEEDRKLFIASRFCVHQVTVISVKC